LTERSCNRDGRPVTAEPRLIKRAAITEKLPYVGLLVSTMTGFIAILTETRCGASERQRNAELMWLTGHLAPDFKTIADFRKDNGKAVRSICRQFVVRCRNLNLFSQSINRHRRQQTQSRQQP
jgi:hypothetical protein